jgi:hypothetical protein
MRSGIATFLISVLCRRTTRSNAPVYCDTTLWCRRVPLFCIYAFGLESAYAVYSPPGDREQIDLKAALTTIWAIKKTLEI